VAVWTLNATTDPTRQYRGYIDDVVITNGVLP
jgi:hypothetical protein